MKNSWGKRTISGGVALAFLATNGLFAYTPETNLWAERRRAVRRQASTLVASHPMGARALFANAPLAAQFPAPQSLAPSLSADVARSVPKEFLKSHAPLLSALSPAHGTIRKVSLSPRPSPLNPVIVHIQDVHMNAEAQRNIGEAVRALMGTGRVGLVALEGATEAIHLQPFVDYPDRTAVDRTADYLLKENSISGPIHAALTTQGKLPRILGIDDPVHYQANVQAYKDSAPKLEETRKWTQELRSGIQAEKKRVFSPALLAFDEKVESYREGKTTLGDYVLLLSSLPLRALSPQISLFQRALTLERTLDFRQVETERARLIEALAATLTKQETDTLLAQSLAYRSGQLRYADFYRQLKDLCRKKGIVLTAYPAMDDYVKYVLLTDGINAEALMEELAEKERAAFRALAKSESERAIVARSRRAWLTGKLADFSLTPVEWREFKTGPIPSLPAPRSSRDISPSLAPFESFYKEADARDDAMANNVVEAVAPCPQPLATVLVTGGFHAEGIAKTLTSNGFTVISYVPKIEKTDTAQGAAYLSVFTQEKTPLDRMFEGEKLYLAQNPWALSIQKTIAPALVVLAGVLVAGLTGLEGNAYAALGGVGLLDHINLFSGGVGATLLGSAGALNVQVAGNGKAIKEVTWTSKNLWGSPKDRFVALFQRWRAKISKDLKQVLSEEISGTSPGNGTFWTSFQGRIPTVVLGGLWPALAALPVTAPTLAAFLSPFILWMVINQVRFLLRHNNKTKSQLLIRGAGLVFLNLTAFFVPGLINTISYQFAVGFIAAIVFHVLWNVAAEAGRKAKLWKNDYRLQQSELEGRFRTIESLPPVLSRRYLYPAGNFFVTVENQNRSYAKTTEGAVTVGISMKHRNLYPEKSDYPRTFIAPSGPWIGEDGANLMQIYFAVALNFHIFRRRTVIVATKAQKSLLLQYLALGNPYQLPDMNYLSSNRVTRFHQEGIYLADRTTLHSKPDGTVEDRGGPPRMLVPSDEVGDGMIEWVMLKDGVAQVGALAIASQENGTFLLSDGDKKWVLHNPTNDPLVRMEALPPLRKKPDFGITFLGQSSGMDPNGLPTNQIIWAGATSLLVDVNAVTVDGMKALGLRPKDVSHVVITHMHEDHVAGALQYFSWAKQEGQKIRLLMEPGIYSLFKSQAEIILNANGGSSIGLEQYFDLEHQDLRFYETTQAGNDLSIKAIPAFHGTPTTSLRVSYGGRTILHTSDTVYDPKRFSDIGKSFIPEHIRTDLVSTFPAFNGSLMDSNRLTELSNDVIINPDTGQPYDLVVFESGTNAETNKNATNHTTPFDLALLPINIQERLLVNHTAALPNSDESHPFYFRLTTPMSTIEIPITPSLKNPNGRATSLWMTMFFEWLGFRWGGAEAAARWGAHYKAHAPAYEWSLGLATAAANYGAALFLAGTAWAMVPLLLTALFLPSHVLPARWFKTDVKVDWGKAGIMAAIYLALVFAAPLLATDFSWTQAFLQAGGWGLALTLHSRFDRKGSEANPSSKGRSYGKAVLGLSIPLVTILLSFVFSEKITSIIAETAGPAILTKIAIGAAARGLGSFITQSIREVKEGRRIRGMEIALWSLGGAIFAGGIVFSLFYPALELSGWGPFTRMAVDMTLFTFFVAIPFHFVWRNIVEVLALPKADRETAWRKVPWKNAFFPFTDTKTRHVFFINYTVQISFWAPLLYLSWAFWPEHMVLVVANASLIWGIVLIFFQDWVARVLSGIPGSVLTKKGAPFPMGPPVSQAPPIFVDVSGTAAIHPAGDHEVALKNIVVNRFKDSGLSLPDGFQQNADDRYAEFTKRKKGLKHGDDPATAYVWLDPFSGILRREDLNTLVGEWRLNPGFLSTLRELRRHFTLRPDTTMRIVVESGSVIPLARAFFEREDVRQTLEEINVEVDYDGIDLEFDASGAFTGTIQSRPRSIGGENVHLYVLGHEAYPSGSIVIGDDPMVQYGFSRDPGITFLNAQAYDVEMVRRRLQERPVVSPSAAAFAELVRREDPGLSEKLLSLGIGDAEDEFYLARELRTEVIGITLNKDLVNTGRVRARREGLADRVTFQATDMTQGLPFETGSFHHVFARLSLQYLNDPQMAEVLLEIRRVLKPGGLFHVVVKSTEDYWPKRVGGKRNTLGMTEVMDGTLLYRRYYSAAELKTTLEKAGFTLLDPGVTPSNERLFKDQLRQHPDEHMSALLSVTVRSPARILLNSASGNAVGHGPLNDVTSIFRLAWRPMALGALAMAGLSFAGLSGRALPVGLLVMYVALGWEQGWLKRFRLKEWRTVTMALGLGLGSSGGYASMDAQDANSTAARLTVEQRAFAAQVTAIVGEKPMDLGVADYMDKAARAAVKMAAEGQAEGPLFPSLEDMKRTPVLFVDARSVATPKQRSSLANFLKDKPNAVIFTNADNLTMKGFDVRVKPEAFTALKTPEENIPSGLLEISLASFGPELTALAQGPGLQFFQTAVLKLNVAGVDEVIAESAKRSWLLTDAFKLLSPAESVNWANVLDALTAIARSA